MAKFTAEQFVTVWMEKHKDASLNDIAEVFGVSRQYIEQFAVRLRKKGVDLPKLSRGNRIDKAITPEVVGALNNLINTHKAEEELVNE